MRRDGTMRLADFVSAILHLTMAFGKFFLLVYLFYSVQICFITFKMFIFSEVFKQKDATQEGAIKLGLNEVSFHQVFIQIYPENFFLKSNKIIEIKFSFKKFALKNFHRK